MIPKENETWNLIDSSILNQFIDCPRRYFYRYILGWQPESPNNHLIFGEAWHKAMEHLYTNGFDDSNVLKAFDKFNEVYRSHFSPEMDEMFEPKTPANAFIVLARYAEKYQRDLEDFEVKYTEIAGTVSVAEYRTLYFRMDTILRRKSNDKMFSLEHKTGSRLWLWQEQWPLDIQPGSYNHVLYCLYPSHQVEGVWMNGSFFIKRKKDPYDFLRVPVHKSLQQMQVWFDTVNHYFSEIEKNMEILKNETELQPTMLSFPIRPADCLSWGRVCEFHDFCNAWPNPLAKCYEVPLGISRNFGTLWKKRPNIIFSFMSDIY